MMIQQIQNAYEQAFPQDTSTQPTALAATTYSARYRPDVTNGCFRLEPGGKSLELLLRGGDVSKAAPGGLRIYGYAVNGPAELIIDITFACGTAATWSESTYTNSTDCYAQYIVDATISTWGCPTGVNFAPQRSIAATGIRKIVFPTTFGYRYIYPEFYSCADTTAEVLGGGGAGKLNVLLRSF